MFVLFFQGEEDTEHICILFLLSTVTNKRVHEGTFDVRTSLFCGLKSQQTGAVPAVFGRL